MNTAEPAGNTLRQFVVIGAGRVAWSLCAALREAGYAIASVISRNESSAEALAGGLGIASYSSEFGTLPAVCSHIIVAVPDQHIAGVAQQLAELPLSYTGKTVLHLSGALDSSVLEPLRCRGAHTGSLHIMQSFPAREVIPLRGAPAAVEAPDQETQNDIADIAHGLRLMPFLVPGPRKTLYHLIGVYLSNFLVSNVFAAAQLYQAAEISGISAKDLFLPILEETLANIRVHGIANALSGPVERASQASVLQHIAALKEYRSSTGIDPMDYIIQSIRTLQAATAKNPRLAEDYRALEHLLQQTLANPL